MMLSKFVLRNEGNMSHSVFLMFFLGGTNVTIHGSGISSTTTIYFSASACKVVSFNYTVLTCLTPESSSSGNITGMLLMLRTVTRVIQFITISLDHGI